MSKPRGLVLRTLGVTEVCSRCGSTKPRYAMQLVELRVSVPDVDLPETMWVCIDGQSCVLSRIFPDRS
jgi:hypothetical protein